MRRRKLKVEGLFAAMGRKEDHADKLDERGNQMHEDEGEERPEAVPNGEVDYLQHQCPCAEHGDSIKDQLVHAFELRARKAPTRIARARDDE